MIKWFGKKIKTRQGEEMYSFLEDDDQRAATLQEFGRLHLSMKKKMSIVQKLPLYLKQHLPTDYVPGPFVDKRKRYFKKEMDVDSLSSMWTVAIPRGKLEELEFPKVGEIVKLYKESSKSKPTYFDVIDIRPCTTANTTLVHLQLA